MVYYGLDHVDSWVVWVSGKGKDVGHRVGVLWRENCVEQRVSVCVHVSDGR